MKCPYITHTFETERILPPVHYPHTYERYDGTQESFCVSHSQAITWYAEIMADCVKDECAAWQNGHCVRT